jgi:thioredoxin reductase
MAKPEPLRIAIIGAGPIGLEAGLYARRLGLHVTIYERGEIGEYLGRWGHVRLFTPFGMNTSPLGLDEIRKEHPQHHLPAASDLLSGIDFREAYLSPLALTSALCGGIQVKTEVLHIGRAGLLKTDPANEPKRLTAPFRILVREPNNSERMDEADVILDCSGTYSRHRWLGEGGIPAIGEIAGEKHIAYGVDDVSGAKKAMYAGKSTLVIGGGYSAATTVCALTSLAEHNAATWVIWVTRGPRGTPLPRNPSDPFRERDRLAARANALATRGEGNLEYHAQTVIDAIESHSQDRGFRVTGRIGGEPIIWEVERVIANVGYVPENTFCRELHVFEPDRTMAVRQLEPNYFILGAKSSGRDSRFLLRMGLDQIREVFTTLLGKGTSDLYNRK